MKRRLMFFFPPEPVGGLPDGGGGGTPPTPGTVGPGKTFTQEDIDRIAAREKGQGERAGSKTVLEAMGFTTAEEAKKFVDEQRAAQAAALTEQQKKDADLAAREAAANAAQATAAQAILDSRKTTALAVAGVAGANLPDAMLLLQIPADADDAAVTAAIDGLKTRRPELFAAVVPPKTKPPLPNGTPGTTPPPNGSGGGQTPGEKGKAEAARRFAKANAGASA